jgi:hypothetical protein
MARNTSFLLKNRGSLLAPVLLSHGWVNLSPAERIKNGFRYSLLIHQTIPVTIEVTAQGKDIKCVVDRALGRFHLNALRRILFRMLSLDFPINDFRNACILMNNRTYLKMARKGFGRMFRSPTPWEDAVKTLCTTNASWPYTQLMCASLCNHLGETTLSGHKTFPLPTKIIRKGRQFLEKEIKLGYRSKSLIELAQEVRTNASWLLKGDCPSEEILRGKVRKWHGFGDYATDHMMVLLGYYNYLPVDREVALHLGIRKPGDSRIPVAKEYAEWGKFRFLAYKFDRIISRKNWIGD